MAPKVLILVGSKNDQERLKPCTETLEEFGVEFELHVSSAHRAPERTAIPARPR